MTRVRTTGIVVTEVKEAPFTYQGNYVAIIPSYNYEIVIIILIIIIAILIIVVDDNNDNVDLDSFHLGILYLSPFVKSLL